jgi:hypothetical protein
MRVQNWFEKCRWAEWKRFLCFLLWTGRLFLSLSIAIPRQISTLTGKQMLFLFFLAKVKNSTTGKPKAI